MRITYGYFSDRGDVRTENQDRVLALSGEVEGKEAGLFVLADGMGGLEYGSSVSTYITDEFLKWWEEDFPQMAHAGKCEKEEIRELLEQEIWDINQAVLAFRRWENCRSGSTISILFVYGDDYYIVNMGDSRVYIVRDGRLRRMTEDQSMAAQLVREGKLTEAQAKHSKQNHILTMCIGMFEIPKNFYTEGKLKSNDSFLLCSDGLYDALSEEEISSTLTRRELKPQERAELLRKMIEPGMAKDNVSDIVVEIMK